MKTQDIEALLTQKRVIVCCGAGGVGKTTVSASLALAAAQRGRRVLVITIDPSKRLAQTLGVQRNHPEPIQLDPARLAQVGVSPPGSLSAWMLDPRRVSDDVVDRLSASPEDAQRLKENVIYKNVASMVAGMQEYTAVEALYSFIKDERYDLVVLDTPPSRNALRFLDAPDRVGAFLDRRIFNLFHARDGGPIRRMAVSLIEKVMDIAFGETTRRDLQTFFELFSQVLGQLNVNQQEMQAFFRTDAASFLLVTSPRQAALEEAWFFERRTRDELGLPLAGYVLNQSTAQAAHYLVPDEGQLAEGDDPQLAQALRHLQPLAEREARQAKAHRDLGCELRARAGAQGLSLVLPLLPEGANDLETLVVLAHALLSGGVDLGERSPSDAAL